MNTFEVDTILYKTLKDCGCSPSMLGFNYTVYAVKCLYASSKRLKITSELYVMVAKMYNTTPSRVERAIRTFVRAMLTYGSPEDIYKVFGNVFKDKTATISNSNFLYALKYELEYQIRLKEESYEL